MVERELVGIQRQLGEQPILLDHEVADPHRREEIALADAFELAHALEQERELGRERVRPRVLVEAREERIVPGRLQQRRASEAPGEPLREGGLAHPDRPLDHDVAEVSCGHRPSRAGSTGMPRGAA